MEKNIFQKMINNKFNPDINIKYNQIQSNRNHQYDYDNRVWKGIITDQITEPVKNANDLKLKLDNPNKESTLHKLEEQMALRAQERLQYEHNINNNKKLDLHQTKNENYKPAHGHDELKTINVKENDRLKKEKERLNQIIHDINELFV